MSLLRFSTRWMLVCAMAGMPAVAQEAGNPQRLVESGQLEMAGQNVPYLIRRLPVNAFPDLPSEVVEQLNQRECMVPQSYEAHHPENVVRASLERAGSSDWALLCSVDGKVSLLVFFGSAPRRPTVLATLPEKDRLQRHDSSGVMGFDWAIDPATPEAVHQAQSGMERKPPRIDHDALADRMIDGKTRYRFFSKGRWMFLDMP
ncbi:MAG TPA: hypothetical protein VGL00_08565 [Terracidiphilus sp.]